MAEVFIQDNSWVRTGHRFAAALLQRGPAMVVLLACLLGGALALAQDNPVNINTAPAEVLADRLSGVGISKAYSIVEHREAFGPFESIEELVEVKGIGPSILERNRGHIVLE